MFFNTCDCGSTYKPGSGRAKWQQVTFSPKWEMPPGSAAAYQKLTLTLPFASNLNRCWSRWHSPSQSVRQLSVQILRYRIAHWRCTKCQPGEWTSSRPIATHVNSPIPRVASDTKTPRFRMPDVNSLQRVVILDRYALSPDGNWLALISHTEKTRSSSRIPVQQFRAGGNSLSSRFFRFDWRKGGELIRLRFS